MVPMTIDVLRFRLLLIVFFVGICALLWLPVTYSSATCSCLQVSFLDVGQGDAILVRTPDNYEMLIDGGRDASILRTLAVERPLFDRTIDVVVATHPDLDHIGGLVDVFARYRVATVLSTTNINDTPASAAFSEAVASENAALIHPNAGERFSLGNETFITILSPSGDETNWESNNASIVLKIEFGETSFLLTGDAPESIEDFLVGTYGSALDSDVLKLGHHGSRTSTSELFLDTVTPQFAVVSAGIGNSYGHPHQEVMQRVFSRNIPTFHTGTDGTVTFVSDGGIIRRQE